MGTTNLSLGLRFVGRGGRDILRATGGEVGGK